MHLQIFDQNEKKFITLVELNPIKTNAQDPLLLSLDNSKLELRQGLFRLGSTEIPYYTFSLKEQKAFKRELLQLNAKYLLKDVPNYNLEKVTYFTRKDLDNGKFQIQAWPEATINIIAQWDSYKHVSNVQLPMEGLGEFSLVDFGFYPRKTNVTFDFSAGPIKTPPFYFQDQPLVTSYQAGWDEKGEALVGSAQIVNLAPTENVMILLIGVEPWSGQLWEIKTPITSYNFELREGCIEFRIACDKNTVRWLSIFPETALETNSARVLPWLSLSCIDNAPKIPTFTLADLTASDEGALEGNWKIWEKRWQSLPRPTDFDNLLHFSSLNRFVDRHIELFQFKRLQRNWLKVSPHLMLRLEILKTYGYKVELFSREPGSDEIKRGLCTDEVGNRQLLELVYGVLKGEYGATPTPIKFFTDDQGLRKTSRVSRPIMQGRVSAKSTPKGVKYYADNFGEIEIAVNWAPQDALDAIFKRVNSEDAGNDPLLADLQEALGQIFEEAVDTDPNLIPLTWLEDALRSTKLLVEWVNQNDLHLQAKVVAELAMGVEKFGRAILALLDFLEKGLNDTDTN